MTLPRTWLHNGHDLEGSVRQFLSVYAGDPCEKARSPPSLIRRHITRASWLRKRARRSCVERQREWTREGRDRIADAIHRALDRYHEQGRGRMRAESSVCCRAQKRVHHQCGPSNTAECSYRSINSILPLPRIRFKSRTTVEKARFLPLRDHNGRSKNQPAQRQELIRLHMRMEAERQFCRLIFERLAAVELEHLSIYSPGVPTRNRTCCNQFCVCCQRIINFQGSAKFPAWVSLNHLRMVHQTKLRIHP